MRTDFELVMACKDGDNTGYIDLLLKYRPLLKNKYRYWKSLNRNTVMEFEDFQQEFFIKLKKLISFVDPEKIYTPNNWIIYNFVKDQLSTLLKELKKKEKGVFDIPYLTQENGEVGVTEYRDKFKPFDNKTEELTLQKVCSEQFLSLLTPFEIKIVKCSLRKPTEKTAPSTEDVSKELGVTGSCIFEYKKKMREDFADMYRGKETLSLSKRRNRANLSTH